MQNTKKEKEIIKYNKLKIFLTGNLGYQGVDQNPTEDLVKTIIAKKDQFNKDNIEIINHKIFEVSTDYVDNNIHSLYKEIEHDKEGDVLFLIVHFGLNTDFTVPQIETTAVNKDGQFLNSKLDTECIVNNMNADKAKKGDCKLSKEVGNQLHNYIYYNSLQYYSKIPNVFTTFIQIPLFKHYSLEQDLNLFSKFLENIKTIYLKHN